jgi:hypothetical protein
MARFRYDVVLRKADGPSEPAVEATRIEAPADCTLDALRALLRGAPPALCIAGVPNARVLEAVRAADLLARGEAGTTAGELCAATQAGPPGLDPGDVRELDPAYDVATTWSDAGIDRFDVIARHKTRGPRAVLVAPAASTEEPSRASLTNTPGHAMSRGALSAELRAYLRGKLPSSWCRARSWRSTRSR